MFIKFHLEHCNVIPNERFKLSPQGKKSLFRSRLIFLKKRKRYVITQVSIE